MQTLLRDGYRCVVSGAFDRRSLKLNADLRARLQPQSFSSGYSSSGLEVAHLFSQSAQDDPVCHMLSAFIPITL